MKKHDLEQLIKTEIREMVPDKLEGINLENHIALNESVREPRSNPLKRLVPSRFLAMAMILIVAGLFFAIREVIPAYVTTTTQPPTQTQLTTQSTDFSTTDASTTDQTTTASTSGTVTNPVTNPITPLNAVEYATPIITASQLSFSMASGMALSLSMRLADPTHLIDGQIDLINQYVNALETALFQSGGYSIEMLASDNENYDYLLQGYGLNLLGEIESYFLYYNVVSSDAEEVEMQGIIQKNNQEFVFEGQMETETQSTKLTFIVYEDGYQSENYIVTEFEAEDEEQSYQMDVYQAGEKVVSSQLSFETETDETKIEVEIERENASIAFEIKKETEADETRIRIDYTITEGEIEEEGSIAVTLLVDPIDGSISYQYNVLIGDDEIEYEEDRHHDQDEDEDDDLSRNVSQTTASI